MLSNVYRQQFKLPLCVIQRFNLKVTHLYTANCMADVKYCIHYLVHNSPPAVTILRQINPGT